MYALHRSSRGGSSPSRFVEITLAASLIALAGVPGCSAASDDSAAPEEGTLASTEIALTIGQGILSMQVDESIAIQATVSTATPARLYTVKYESSNSQVATVSPVGLVKAVGNGSSVVKVTATLLDTGGTASATVNVSVGGGTQSGLPSPQPLSAVPVPAGTAPPTTAGTTKLRSLDASTWEVTVTGNTTARINVFTQPSADPDFDYQQQTVVGALPAGTPKFKIPKAANTWLRIGAENSAGYAPEKSAPIPLFEGAAPPSPAPTTMQPPAGMALIRDLSRLSYWTPETVGATINELSEKGPGGEVVIRNTLVDGQTGASSAVPSERSDLQGGTVPLNSVRWMLWYERIVSLPTTTIDRWQLLGPNEIHGQTLTQATVMPEIGPDKRQRLNANAGLPQPRYFDMGAVVLNKWSQVKFGVKYTQNSNGWIEVWRDGTRLVRIDGQTTAEARDGYWKFGNYRNANINGTTTMDISSCRVYGQ